MAETLNALDTFSGACGGWHLGFERAGINVIAGCESDRWRRAVYQRVYCCPVYDDIRGLTADRLRNDGLWPIHIVCGSPPCQDASSANPGGRGIDGERTGLFMEAVRLIDEIRPAWLSLENVPFIRNRGIDRVLRELDAIGYACWPLVVGARHVGAPHIRQRLWLLGAHTSAVQRLAVPGNQSDGDRAGAAPASDRQGNGWGQGQARRSDRRAEEQAEQAFHAITESSIGQRPGPNEPFSESEGRPGRPSSDADGAGIWIEPGRGGGPGEPNQASLAARDAVESDREGEPRFAFDEEMAGLLGQSCRKGVASDALSSGLEGPQGIRSDDGPELAPLERAIIERCGARALDWNGGIAGRLNLDDGLSDVLARRSGNVRIERGKPHRTSIGRELLAALGDSILPQIAELIGRAILRAEGLI